MTFLIDGYNLMHAVILPGGKLGPNRLRKLRHGFLNQLAAKLGPERAQGTTVVFDAGESSPSHLPTESRHKGITVIFAQGDQDADERIEAILSKHSAPKKLTVVSSDNRLRLAAKKRRARPLGAEEFWEELSRTVPPRVAKSRPDISGRAVDIERTRLITEAESAFWQEQFREVEAIPELGQLAEERSFVPSAEEIERIRREVAEEP